jgi:type IV pilus assembly protein PilP
MVRILGNLLLIAGMLTAYGCGSSAEGPIAQKLPFPTSGKMSPPQAVVAIPAVPATPAALSPRLDPIYDPTGKPDPFQPPVLGNGGDLRSRGTRGLPLQQFEVTEFELVGIVSGSGENQALVQDASGKGYLVKVGTPIGKNQGRVVAIASKRILIEEKVKDFMGREKSRIVALKIPQAP